MEPVKIFSGNEEEAGMTQHLLNSHSIGTWVRQVPVEKNTSKGNSVSVLEIFIEAELEAKARWVLAAERQTASL